MTRGIRKLDERMRSRIWTKFTINSNLSCYYRSTHRPLLKSWRCTLPLGAYNIFVPSTTPDVYFFICYVALQWLYSSKASKQNNHNNHNYSKVLNNSRGGGGGAHHLATENTGCPTYSIYLHNSNLLWSDDNYCQKYRTPLKVASDRDIPLTKMYTVSFS
jgi:hypothetical protein